MDNSAHEKELLDELFSSTVQSVKRFLPRAKIGDFEIPIDDFDEQDLWPLSLKECQAFFGSPAVCDCGLVLIVPKNVSTCYCKSCHRPIPSVKYLKFMGPLDDLYHNSALSDGNKSFRSKA